MTEFEFRGTFTFVVQATDEAEALETLNAQLGEVLLSWNVDEVSSG